MSIVVRSAIFLLLPLVCFGQLTPAQQAIFKAASVPLVASGPAEAFNITNEPSGSGAYVVSWYHYTDYKTNGSTVVLPDRGGTHTYDLTNSGATSLWPAQTSDGIVFDGANDYLKNEAFWVAQSNEIVMVFASTTASNLAQNAFFFDATNSGNRQYCYQPTDGTWQQLVASGNTFAKAITNTWIMLDLLYNNTLSQAYTNTVVAHSGAVGAATPMNGLTLANRYSLTFPSSYILKDFVVYAQTNSATQRSQQYYYYKTIKGYPLP